MELQASDIHELHRPSRCGLRVQLAKGPVVPSTPDAFIQLLKELGLRHEERHLQSLGDFLDLSGDKEPMDFAQRRDQTLLALRRGDAVLYQPVFFGWRRDGAEEDFITGIPDLLIREGDGYVIRDCKLAHHASEEHHPEILRQVELYGWLYERAVGKPPVRLEVLLGDGSVAELAYDGGVRAMAALDEVKQAATMTSAAYEPVGVSKCGGCVFHDHCWSRAEQARDVALVPQVDQSLARYLHAQQVGTYDQLAAAYQPEALAEVKRPVGRQIKRVGAKAALSILRHAQAFSTGAVEQIDAFPLALDARYVVFDLEGLPRQLDDLDRTYLWGMQLFGVEQGEYQPALAPLGLDGDLRGWERFLEIAKGFFDVYGDLPFVHWAAYERTMVKLYLGRYGDRDGVGQRVLENLVDILRVAQATVVLPKPSYSLKVVEELAGYKRSMDEYGGSWSIAQYIKAVESEDTEAYQDAIGEILRYNREDLEATWAVFRWLATNYSGVPSR